MVKQLSNPPQDAHVGACGLFCTNCGAFKKGRCQGCQVKPGFSCCPVRGCCEGKGITNCSRCGDFATPRDYRDCRKVNSFISKIFAFLFRSNRPRALALLRDEGLEEYLAEKRATGMH